MLTLLLGSNFSGRSEWLAERRKSKPWPLAISVGPYPDLACTGLTSIVGEEIVVATSQHSLLPAARKILADKLDLNRLASHEIRTLSGGESVRLAMLSVAAQNVDELHIDTSLEQLDGRWRKLILLLLADEKNSIARNCFLADNHLTKEEVQIGNGTLQFPQDEWRATLSTQTLEPSVAIKSVTTRASAKIVIEQMTFSYGRQFSPIFENVSLCLEPSAPYFLLGDNGSGKTTFVKLLCGTLLPTGGRISFGSTTFQPGKSTRRFAGVAFQNPDFQWTTQSVSAELVNSYRDKEQRLDIKELLASFGVPKEVLQSHPNELPFVIKKRLGIVLAARSGMPWLIFDEPTLGQDTTYRTAFAQFIELVLGLGAGVIMISHDTFFRSLFARSRGLLFKNRAIHTLE
jgi:energy-coupling factor transporter ATP-binding protein EcfA2